MMGKSEQPRHLSVREYLRMSEGTYSESAPPQSPAATAKLWLVENVLEPLGAVPVALSGCSDLDCLAPVFIGAPLAVLGAYPLFAKLVAPDASYGKRLLGSSVVALAVGHVIIRQQRRERK